jgi:hypothetical protein
MPPPRSHGGMDCSPATIGAPAIGACSAASDGALASAAAMPAEPPQPQPPHPEASGQTTAAEEPHCAYGDAFVHPAVHIALQTCRRLGTDGCNMDALLQDMDRIGHEHVTLDPSLRRAVIEQRPVNVPIQQHVAICHDSELSAGIFLLPPGARMAFHDHPGMWVVARVLYGGLECESFDVIETDGDDGQTLAGERMALAIATGPAQHGRGEIRRHDAPCNFTLQPNLRNLHGLVAGPQGCILLDVATPPYGNGRNCTIFQRTSKEISSAALRAVVERHPRAVLLHADVTIRF